MAAETEVAPGDRINKALEELESEKSLMTTCTTLWKNLSDHFSSLHNSLSDRSQTLDSRLRSLDSDTDTALKALSDREASIPSIQSAAAALVEQRRDAALAELQSPDASSAANVQESLRRYCRWMESAGLWRFMVSRRKDLASLRKEVVDAVAGSVDPPRLVLDAVEDFVLGSKETGPGDQSWACGMLLRGLFDAEGRNAPKVSGRMREKAGEVVEAWKKMVDERGEGGKMGGPEAQMFLQLLVAFGVQERVDQELLKKLVVEFALRKEMPKLAAGLGFGDKIGDIIDELVSTGKELEAVYFAHECGMTEQFSPVSLLKAYHQNSSKKANAILEKDNHSTAAKEESSTTELNALKSIAKCVEVLKLEQEYPLGSIRKQISVLEKAKADRKKTVAGNKSKNKRTRINGAPSAFRPAKATRTPNIPYPSFQRDPSITYQMPAARQPVNFLSQVAYEGPRSSGYGGAYSRSPASLHQQYYGAEDMVGARGSGSYGGPPPNYSGYDYATGVAAPAQSSYPNQPPYTWHSDK